MRSIRSHVSRTTFLLGRGSNEVTRSTACSRSKIQQPADVRTKKILMKISKPRSVASRAWSTALPVLGTSQPAVELDQRAAPPACLFGALSRQCVAADGRLDLVDRPGNDEPEEEGHDSCESEIVGRDAGAPREASPCHGLDSGRIAAARMNARKRRAIKSLSFQSASRPTTTQGRSACRL